MNINDMSAASLSKEDLEAKLLEMKKLIDQQKSLQKELQESYFQSSEVKPT